MKDSIEDILSFWFIETAPVQWFQVSPVFDETVRDRFLDLFLLAKKGVCDDWARSADGALALILLFDQFPRVMFRDTAEAYATDDKALSVAMTAVSRGFDQLFVAQRRYFFYVPFKHAEDLESQERSVLLYMTMREDDPMAYEYALRHRDIIARFGRFPHRNAFLGRENTDAERAYLKESGRLS